MVGGASINISKNINEHEMRKLASSVSAIIPLIITAVPSICRPVANLVSARAALKKMVVNQIESLIASSVKDEFT